MFPEVIQLKKLIEQCHLPLKFLAELCGCTSKSISNYITGESVPNGNYLIKIRQGLEEFKNRVNEIL